MQNKKLHLILKNINNMPFSEFSNYRISYYAFTYSLNNFTPFFICINSSLLIILMTMCVKVIIYANLQKALYFILGLHDMHTLLALHGDLQAINWWYLFLTSYWKCEVSLGRSVSYFYPAYFVWIYYHFKMLLVYLVLFSWYWILSILWSNQIKIL